MQGRTRVNQWRCAAAATVGAMLMCIDLAEIFDPGKAAPKLHQEARNIASRWLGDLDHHLTDRAWIACADFTVADIMMSCVLRSIRKTELMHPFATLTAYYERSIARPAWQRTLALSAERLGMSVDEIR